MKIYLVGGAVRDQLLDLPVKERDWVVVGATVEDMQRLGYRQVGKEFPVFLDPKKGEEYALARRERKVAPGYKGFTFDTSQHVTLEDDLLRRDLTINAMAKTKEGKLIDPYGGQKDLEKKLLRHVSPAFAEDPVRILRVGRFLARYYHLGFRVADETMQLMTQMVKAGEVDALVAERVWKELERALAEKNPEQFFVVLKQCGALEKLFPEIATHPADPSSIMEANSNIAMIRFAILLHACDKNEIAALCRRYRVPNDYQQLAKLTAAHYATALRARALSAVELVELFGALDIYRRAERFDLFLAASYAIAVAEKKDFDKKWLTDCAHVARSYDVQKLIAQGLDGKELADAIRIERINAISKLSGV